jgi:hypothetical protein
MAWVLAHRISVSWPHGAGQASLLLLTLLVVIATPAQAVATAGYEVRPGGREFILPVRQTANLVIAVSVNARNRVQLVLETPSSTVEYSTTGRVSRRRIAAHFADLGRINLRLRLFRHASGPPHTGRCRGLAPLYEEGTYSGLIAFSPLGDLPKIFATRGHAYFEHRFKQICMRPPSHSDVGRDNGSGRTVEFGLLRLAGQTEGWTIRLAAMTFLSPTKRAHSVGNLVATTYRRRDGVKIVQRVSTVVDHRSVAMTRSGIDPETVTVRPPAPFSGRALYTRRLGTFESWAGDLSLDLPTGERIPLTGTGLRVDFCRGLASRKVSPCKPSRGSARVSRR